MSFSINRVSADTKDQQLLDALLRFTHDVDHEIDPTHPPLTSSRLLTRLMDDAVFARQVLVAIEAGSVLGTSTLYLNRLEANREKAEAGITVHPEARRRGIGTALLRATIDPAIEDDRTSLLAFNPLTTASEGFWSAFGCPVKQSEQESRCWLNHVDSTAMDSWSAGHVRSAGYQLVKFIGRCPEQHLSSFIQLRNASNDAPLDDLEWDRDRWSGKDIRAMEALTERRDQEQRTILALDPSGNAAGLTEVTIANDQPAISEQGWTIVLAEHRGKRLGRWIKASMYQWLQEERPDVLALDTENAQSNGPMLDINVAMGFQPLTIWGAWQSDLETLDAAVPVSCPTAQVPVDAEPSHTILR